MFGWIKSLFGIEKKVAQEVTPSVEVEQNVAQPVVKQEPVPEEPAKKVVKKTTKKKAAPKKKAPKKVEVDLEGMTKLELDVFARDKGLKVDRRKTKAYMIEQIKNHLKEN